MGIGVKGKIFENNLPSIVVGTVIAAGVKKTAMAIAKFLTKEEIKELIFPELKKNREVGR